MSERVSRLCLLAVAGSLFVASCTTDNNTGDNPDLSVAAGADLAQPVVPADMTGVAAGDMNGVATVDMTSVATVDMLDNGDMIPPQGPDMAIMPCGNTPNSCGMPGACADCTSSLMGHACVATVCGCNSFADCPAGSACDPNTHLCGARCAPAMMGGQPLACNGGCCDGTNCVAGSANNACGAQGGACIACGGGTPTCTAGACTSTCAPGGMGGAACGQGFCCNAKNTCAAVGNMACGADGAACADCTNAASGPICDQVKRTCGCTRSADCPMGQACKAGVCGAACDANTPCNGGCCDSGKNLCDPGTAFDQCALGMNVCGTCVGNAKGGACIAVNGANQCGCTSSNDCPANQACNTTTHACGVACDVNTPCNGGCCTAAMNGTCAAGTLQATCGNNGGLCNNCLTQFQGMKSGQVCEAVAGGGSCGCGANGDCPVNSTGCNVNIKQCNFNCSAMAACLTGCCNIPMGQVQGTCGAGTGNGACGGNGVCSDCSLSAAGHVCVANTLKCGCAVSADCPADTACNTTTHVCEAVCGDAAHTACNGGCCANGTCNAGNGNNTCGAKGLACVSCAANNLGHVCLNGANCGCNAAADCPANTACNTNTHQCEAACGDANHTVCNAGCCQTPMGMQVGSCVAGTQNAACGNKGGACTACANGTPTCTAGACAADCGNVGNGTCAGGFCCSANKCVTGNVSNACGVSGACNDCTMNAQGKNCLVNVPLGGGVTGNACGCNAAAADKGASDCPSATGNSPGAACDSTGLYATCTTACGKAGVSPCNGGCCSGANGNCQAGTANNACGNSGGFCSNCGSNNCSPGPVCANHACGCAVSADCANAFSCGNQVPAKSTCTNSVCVCGPKGTTCQVNGQCCSNACVLANGVRACQ